MASRHCSSMTGIEDQHQSRDIFGKVVELDEIIRGFLPQLVIELFVELLIDLSLSPSLSLSIPVMPFVDMDGVEEDISHR